LGLPCLQGREKKVRGIRVRTDLCKAVVSLLHLFNLPPLLLNSLRDYVARPSSNLRFAEDKKDKVE
jgi:hypothetical protein